VKRVLPYLPALCCSAIIPLLSLINPGKLPDTTALHLAGLDKIIHFLMYAVLTTLWLYPMKAAQRAQLRTIFGVALVTALYGVLMELCQFLFTSSRQMDALDAMANLAGSMIVATGFYFCRKKNASIAKSEELGL
jgi:VanZ family protein